MEAKNRYTKLIESIFTKHYEEGKESFRFVRTEIEETAAELGIQLPKNLGDLVYTFRYRSALPKSITSKAKEGYEWIIRSAGKSTYSFVLVKQAKFLPNDNLVNIKIPDATPGIVSKYALTDEQSLLAKIRYNRLVDIFTGTTCYSLQNHLRTTITGVGQVETDELYVGVDKQGAHYVFPVQAKGGNDKIGIVQIEQDFQICAEKYPGAIGRPIAAQFLDDQTIALFEFVFSDGEIKVLSEKHYRLVRPDELSDQEIAEYQRRITQ